MKPHAGDWVQVRSKQEILETLDKDGCLDGVPFMPQMFKYCGRRFQIESRAYKTCDTVSGVYKGLRLPDAVHLSIRCDGQAFGGCQAGCLIFWKNAWLNPLEDGTNEKGTRETDQAPVYGTIERQACTDQDVRTSIARKESNGETR